MKKKMYKVSGTNVIIGDTDECGKVFSVSKLKRTFAIEVAGGEHQNHRRKKEPERRKKEQRCVALIVKMNVHFMYDYSDFRLIFKPCQLSWRITRRFPENVYASRKLPINF